MTLVETVIALFLLVVGMVLIGTLFLSGLRYCARIEKRALATLIAEKKLASLRAWARKPNPGGFNYDDWSSVDGQQGADPDEGNFVVRVTAHPRDLKSAATSLEDGQDPAKRRLMPGSAMEVCVSVWEASDPAQVTRLWSLIGEPERPFDPIAPLTVTPLGPVPALMAYDDELSFNVKAVDSAGKDLKDIFFSWYVLPRGGNGTIKQQSRDGKNSTFIHRITILPPGDLPPGIVLHAGGTVDVVARAVYRGRELEGHVTLELAP